MKLEDLAPAPNSRKLAEVTRKTFGFEVDLDSLTIAKAEQIKETFVKRLVQLDHSLGARATTDKRYFEAKLVLETVNKFISEAGTMVCKDCGCECHNPKPGCDCPHDCNDESGSHWVMGEGSYGKKKKKAYESVIKEESEGINEDETGDAFDMIHQGVKDMLQQMSGRGSKFQASMAKDHPKLSKHIQDTLVGLLQTMNSSLQNGKIVAESVVMEEGEMQDSETVMAAVHITDRIQGMLQDLGEIMNEDLPPLVDSIRNTMDIAKADAYSAAVSGAVEAALEAVRTARESVDGAARTLTGEAPAMGDVAAEPAADAAAPPADDAAAPPADDAGLGAADTAAGGEEPMGREEQI